MIANPLLSGILISIHPPREGWDVDAIGGFNVLPISIHPPREGWDLALLTTMLIKRLFQSTHPVRGGTRQDRGAGGQRGISIHPPREGWDWRACPLTCWQADFNPPTP